MGFEPHDLRVMGPTRTPGSSTSLYNKNPQSTYKSNCMKSKMAEIYEPAEDSFLMSEALKERVPKMLIENPNLKFIEIGCGSGINMETAKEVGVKIKNIMGCDINNEAVEHCKRLGFSCIKSDLFDNVDGKCDVITFNPPYLPKDKKEPKSSRVETTGGKKGNEIIVRFLKEAKSHLTQNGRIFVITSSLAQNVDFLGLGYKAKEIASKKLFFEKLFIWECLKV